MMFKECVCFLVKCNDEIIIKTYFTPGYDVKSLRDKDKNTQHMSTTISQGSVEIDGILFEEFDNPCVETVVLTEPVPKGKGKKSCTRSGRKITPKTPWSPSKPGVSGLNVPVPDTDSESDDSQPCCVCNQQSPPSLKNSMQLVIVNWGKCSSVNCSHWVHLKYCHAKNSVSKTETFFCPCCERGNSEQ